MSKPQETDVDEKTLEGAGEAFDHFNEMEKEEEIGFIDPQGEDEEEEKEEEDTRFTELEGKLKEMEALLQPYGGAEGAKKALDIVKNSPAY